MTAYLRFGLLTGAAVALVGNFATRSAGGSPGEMLAFWVSLGLIVGLLVAFALERASRAEKNEEEAPPPRQQASGDHKSVTGTLDKFYALSRKPSSSELRAMMVDVQTIPGSPIQTRLQLIVERYDGFARFTIPDGSLLDDSVDQISQAALREAMTQAPGSAKGAELQLTYLRSEGPLDKDGSSPFGWTFVCIDGELGLECTVTVTHNEMLFLYRTAVSYPRLGEIEWVDPARALDAVTAAYPQLADVDLYMRVNYPTSYHLFTRRPLNIFGFNPSDGRVFGPESLAEPIVTTPLLLAELIGLLGETKRSSLAANLLEHQSGVLHDTGRRLFDSVGPAVVEEITLALKTHEDDEELCHVLLRVLSRIPSGLVLLALHRLTTLVSDELLTTARYLFGQRRNRELGVFPDPTEPLDFEESRLLMGTTNCRRLGLRSTYDPEGDLLPPLERLGLKPTRVRLLSGDTELFLSAYLRGRDQRTEALLSSSPLPVPCHVIRIVGPEAEALADRISDVKLDYTQESILRDIETGRPDDLHRATLYMSALGLDNTEAFEPLERGFRSNATNHELRRACIAAISQLDHPGVDEFLKSIDDPEMKALATELWAEQKKSKV
jgi:hypothetical protein